MMKTAAWDIRGSYVLCSKPMVWQHLTMTRNVRLTGESLGQPRCPDTPCFRLYTCRKP